MIPLLLSLSVAQTFEIRVDANKPTIPVSKSLYGIFFEEINQAGEGGLYAELLRDRGFDELTLSPKNPAWRLEGGGTLTTTTDVINHSRPLSLRLERTSDRPFSVANEGFWGIAVRKGGRYRLQLWTKGDTPLDISLQERGKILARANVANGSSWQRHELILKPTESVSHAKLVLSPAQRGSVQIGYASLMPVQSLPFREDLLQKLKDMRPGFVRFPGGCFVEGETLPIRWNWKDTLGSIETRRGMPRSQWGYPISNGLGYHEYLLLCEALRAEPMFVANVGMSHREVAPMSAMAVYLQDTLDAIEYANGPVTSTWGARRAKNGHPKPFGLKYVEIGNENGGAAYNERFKLFSDSIGQKYPGVERIANLWGGLPTSASYELIDEHYYNSPAWFWRNTDRYNSYKRTGPKIYVGEYAVTQGSGRGNLAGALGEAAFMTGMERNADVVRLASYAPLLENVNNRQWNPNAILFDSARSYGTPSYWVQALFGQNRVDKIVEHSITTPPAVLEPIGGGLGLVTWRTAAEFKDIQVKLDSLPRNLSPKLNDVRGVWSIDTEGTIRQTSLDENQHAAVAGVDTHGAKHVTISLKARKLSGAEGFIIVFEESARRRIQWNLGGWNNTVHAFQLDDSRFGKGVPGAIDENRWYDIRIEQDPDSVAGYLDGKLVEEVKLEPAANFAAVAGIDQRSNAIVLKIVNGASQPRQARLDLRGVKRGANLTAITLAGRSLEHENSFANPLRVAPSVTKFKLADKYTFPPYSLTILRVPRR